MYWLWRQICAKIDIKNFNKFHPQWGQPWHLLWESCLPTSNAYGAQRIRLSTSTYVNYLTQAQAMDVLVFSFLSMNYNVSQFFRLCGIRKPYSLLRHQELSFCL
jgi:hypothetical protein